MLNFGLGCSSPLTDYFYFRILIVVFLSCLVSPVAKLIQILSAFNYVSTLSNDNDLSK